MTEGYTILKKDSARIGVLICSLFALATLALEQWYTVKTGGAILSTQFLFAYVPILFMLAASLLRSYLFFMLAVLYQSVHLLLAIVFRFVDQTDFNLTEMLDLLMFVVLLGLSAALSWQALLFFTGHADDVALVHTSLVLVILSAVMIFVPFIVRVFHHDTFLMTTADVVVLGLSYLIFAHSIRPIPKKEEATTA